MKQCVAALLGFTTIAVASFAIATFIAGLFLLLFLAFLILALTATREKNTRQIALCGPVTLWPIKNSG